MKEPSRQIEENEEVDGEMESIHELGLKGLCFPIVLIICNKVDILPPSTPVFYILYILYLVASGYLSTPKILGRL